MNRRHFLTVLGGVIGGIAAKPVLALVPAPVAETVAETAAAIEVRTTLLTLDEINAIAFMIHGEAFPENREHYRQKALLALQRVRKSR